MAEIQWQLLKKKANVHANKQNQQGVWNPFLVTWEGLVIYFTS